MNFKKIKRKKLRDMQQLAENIDFSVEQKTLTSTAYEPQTDYKDPSCLYARGCTLNCISCKRLK